MKLLKQQRVCLSSPRGEKNWLTKAAWTTIWHLPHILDLQHLSHILDLHILPCILVFTEEKFTDLFSVLQRNKSYLKSACLTATMWARAEHRPDPFLPPCTAGSGSCTDGFIQRQHCTGKEGILSCSHAVSTCSLLCSERQMSHSPCSLHRSTAQATSLQSKRQKSCSSVALQSAYRSTLTRNKHLSACFLF